MKIGTFLFLVLLAIGCELPAGKMDHAQWDHDQLELPIAIRKPMQDEMTMADSSLFYWNKRNQTVLEEGFVFFENEDYETDRYKFYSEINIDNSELWKLSRTLIDGFNNDDVYIVHELHGDTVSYGEHYDKNSTLEKLDKIESDILNNCYVGIGIAQNSEIFNELFIHESKFVKYWGNNESHFRSVMKTFRIPEKEELTFVDEFPKIVYDWNYLTPNAMTNEELIDYLEN